MKTMLPERHPLVLYVNDPKNLEYFCKLDDTVIWGALPLLAEAQDASVSELSKRLLERRLFKAIDVSAVLQTRFDGIEDEGERDESRRAAEAEIRARVRESGLLESSSDSSPRVLDDVVQRDPYRSGGGDEAALDMIYAVDRTGSLRELSQLSKVVAALKKYETYRIYFRREDEDVEVTLMKILEERS